MTADRARERRALRRLLFLDFFSVFYLIFFYFSFLSLSSVSGYHDDNDDGNKKIIIILNDSRRRRYIISYKRRCRPVMCASARVYEFLVSTTPAASLWHLPPSLYTRFRQNDIARFLHSSFPAKTEKVRLRFPSNDVSVKQICEPLRKENF